MSKTPAKTELSFEDGKIYQVLTATGAGRMCRNRVVEWLTTGIFISFAITVFLTPETIEKGAFRYLLELHITPDLFKWSMLVMGLVRACALYYNGHGLPWSARTRAVCAIFGAICFGHLTLSLAYLTKDTGVVSLGVGVYALLACCEIYSCLRAGADVSDVTHLYRPLADDQSQLDPRGRD